MLTKTRVGNWIFAAGGDANAARNVLAYLDEQAVPAQPERCRITARMALSHTTGMPNWRKGGYPYKNLMSRKSYEKQKYTLQVELLKLQA